MPSTPLNSCLNILRRTPLNDTEQNVSALGALILDEQDREELFQRVDSLLKIAEDPNAQGKKFLLIDHSRDGDSHRSPWSNNYYPPIDETDDVRVFKPSQPLRKFEVIANEVFGSYCEMYYGKGDNVVSSVYLWDKEEINGSSTSMNEFSGCFLISKRINDDKESGFWNSIHVVDIESVIGGKTKYKLTTTLLLSLQVKSNCNGEGQNETQITGSLTKQAEKTCAVQTDLTHGETMHILNIGQMIEEIETEMRSSMDMLQIQKTKEVMDSIHCNSGIRQRSSLMAAMMTRNGK